MDWIPPNMTDANPAAIERLREMGMELLDAARYVSITHTEMMTNLSDRESDELEALREKYADIFTKKE